MSIFTRFLGTSQEGRNQVDKYFAVFDTENTSDVAIVHQNNEGSIYYVCDCCVWKKYRNALPILDQFKQFRGLSNPVIANEGGNIERFIQEQQAKAAPLSPYYKKMYELDSRRLNDSHIRNQPAELKKKVLALREQIAMVEAEIAKTESGIPEAEASVREHERILAEGLPEVPVVEVVRLETLAVEGEETQKPLFSETVSAASNRD